MKIDGLPAILLTSINYFHHDMGTIMVPMHTVVYVDTINSIALIGSDHVHIEKHEYSILHS